MKNRNHVRKNSINAIMSHPLYAPIGNTGKIEGQRSIYRSIKIKIPKAINRNVIVTINLLGGVHPPIYYSPNYL
jgi:hypothetical protein